MSHINTRHLLLAAIALAAIATTGLWSWNTLAELLGAPAAQPRHVVAALALFAVLRVCLLPSRSRSPRCSRHTGSTGTPT